MILILSGMPYAISGLSMYVPYFANCQDTMVGQQCSTSIHSTTEGMRVSSGWTETGQWQAFHTSHTKKAQVWAACLPGTL